MENFSVILVPQGAEYQAVCKGLSRSSPRPIVQAIPVGVQPVRVFLNQLLNPLRQPEIFSPPASVLVLGLCGSLAPTLAVGDVVLYRQCLSLADPALVLNLSPHFPDRKLRGKTIVPRLVTGLTSDRVLWAAAEKQQLGQTHSADVVDMEGTAILEVLSQLPVTMLRVVSDDCDHDLPDLSKAVSPAGRLLPGQLAIAMVKKPIAATRLIRGSLQGLKVLEKVVSELFHTE